MSYDIQGKIAQARADYESALAKLEAARSHFENGPRQAYEAALEQQKALAAKITACHTDAKAAEEAFKQSFEAAGYERTATVRQALNRKNDALAMAEELEAAQARAQAQCMDLLIEVSPKARTLLDAHRWAGGAYAQLRAYEAMEQVSSTLQKAMALAARVLDNSGDSLGRAAISTQDRLHAQRRNLAFIWDGLLQMALEDQEPPTLPFAAPSIAPLTPAELLTPAQLHQARGQKTAGGRG